MAKWLAVDAGWQAGNIYSDTHGGFGFANTYDVERKFCETRIYGEAPVSSNMIPYFVGTKVLGLPKSYLTLLASIVARAGVPPCERSGR